MSLRTVLRGGFGLVMAPDEAFPLFTALGEKEWVPGWDPELVFPASGELEQDQVFLTGEGDEKTFWYVSQVDFKSHRVDYIRNTPTSRVARVHVEVHPDGTGSKVDVTYVWTALSESGAREIEAAAAGYEAMMGEWKRLVDQRFGSLATL